MAGEAIARSALNPAEANAAFRADVLAGLSQRQKAVPARWLYDARGSELFEAITRLPEYYLTRAETSILETCTDELRALTGLGKTVVEFGSGSSAKTPLVLRGVDAGAYVPLDISGDFLRASVAELSEKFPRLPIHPVEADFMKQIALPPEVEGAPKLGFFPGSTIGNMVPSTAIDLLRSIRVALGDGAMLLIGMDLIKNTAELQAAYDDAQGITAEFNLNLALRINRELSGTIPTGELRHEVRWNDLYARIEMHLTATKPLSFEVSGRHFLMDEGETIHTENSHKFDIRSQNMLLLASGWTPLRNWTDNRKRFSVTLAEISPERMAP